LGYSAHGFTRKIYGRRKLDVTAEWSFIIITSHPIITRLPVKEDMMCLACGSYVAEKEMHAEKRKEITWKI
jgi:hypothetical protein